MNDKNIITNDSLTIADKKFSSRLILGTGKFSSTPIMKEAILSSQTEMVTVALRRVNLESPNDDFLTTLQQTKVIFLPNTSGARNAEEAIRLAQITKKATGNPWIKLEVIPDVNYLLPDPVETLKAAEQLVKEGFHVMPYMNSDPVLAKKLSEVGCVSVMPLAAPIGTNKGITNKEQLKIIVEQAEVPVVIDAGLGAPSHACEAMEMGADAVLVNTAIAVSENPKKIAEAFALAVESGRKGFLAGLPNRRERASASSPLTGFLS